VQHYPGDARAADNSSRILRQQHDLVEMFGEEYQARNANAQRRQPDNTWRGN
jgi:hypothetical protein